MQQGVGLDVTWVTSDEFDAMNPNVAPGMTLGSSYSAGDGYIDPPSNVLAYTAAMVMAGVEVYEATTFTALTIDDGAVAGVETDRGSISTPGVVLTGGPSLAAVGRAAGAKVFAGATRHQVVVTEDHPALDASRLPMVFDLPSGIYWRPEEAGLMWGMSNPAEEPGQAHEFDWAYYETMRRRMAEIFPLTAELGLRRVWAATIDYTPDHLPILGPVLRDDRPVSGTVIASAGGHGMMWGPGVSRVAADLVLDGKTDLIDTAELGLDRFDDQGHSRLDADPIALPFPQVTEQPLG
jgi:sarcosine oxidase subunit beta